MEDIMGRWRDLFVANSQHFKWEGTEYDFGQPATAEQIMTAESLLMVKLPEDLREMLTEFNGIHYSGSGEQEIFYLDLQHISVEVPNYFRDVSDPVTGNPLPPEDDLKKVVFFCHKNGFGDLWGVCVEEVEGHGQGAVVYLDHEVGELEPCCASIEEFVRSGPWF